MDPNTNAFFRGLLNGLVISIGLYALAGLIIWLVYSIII